MPKHNCGMAFLNHFPPALTLSLSLSLYGSIIPISIPPTHLHIARTRSSSCALASYANRISFHYTCRTYNYKVKIHRNRGNWKVEQKPSSHCRVSVAIAAHHKNIYISNVARCVLTIAVDVLLLHRCYICLSRIRHRCRTQRPNQKRPKQNLSRDLRNDNKLMQFSASAIHTFALMSSVFAFPSFSLVRFSVLVFFCFAFFWFFVFGFSHLLWNGNKTEFIYFEMSFS